MSSTDNLKKEYLRFGIMCDDLSFNKFQIKIIKNILELDYVALKLIIINNGPKNKIKKNKGFFYYLNHFIYGIYDHLNGPEILERIDCSNFFQKIPKINCKYKLKGKYSQYFLKKDIEQIKSYKLDFILRFGFNIIRGEILKTANYGVWSFHHGDEMKYRGGPPCFWEIYYSDPITGCVLQRLTNILDGGIILKKGYFITQLLSSFKKNRQNLYKSTINWPKQVCIDIHNGNANYLLNRPSKSNASIYRAPKNNEMGRYFLNRLKYFIKYYKATFLKFPLLIRREFWNIGIINQPIENVLDNNSKFFDKVKWVSKIFDFKFRADPFGIKYKGNYYIFFEEYDYKKENGHISCVKIKKNGDLTNPSIAINPKEHLSYPFLFKYKEEIYCLPGRKKYGISLYKAIDFPKKWKRQCVLLENKRFSDSTIVKYKNLWWLFTYNHEDCGLYLFYSKNPLGNWAPHKKNPVKQDIRSSRPAGTLFFKDNFLFRPSMDLSIHYGRQIFLNRIKKLNKNDFKEETIKIIEPKENWKYQKGIHTLSRIDQKYTLIDAKDYKIMPHSLSQLRKFIKTEIKNISMSFIHSNN